MHTQKNNKMDRKQFNANLNFGKINPVCIFDFLYHTGFDHQLYFNISIQY